MANATVQEGSMTNLRLAEAFLLRASSRLEALDSLRAEADISDVVREARDIVELCFRGMLRSVGIAVPRWIDIRDALRDNLGRLPADVAAQGDRILEIYANLQRESRELMQEEALPLSERPIVPEAERAFAGARWILELARLTIDIVAHRRVPATPV